MSPKYAELQADTQVGRRRALQNDDVDSHARKLRRDSRTRDDP
jgi:hypothetical protein